jgi:hypothetical protein
MSSSSYVLGDDALQKRGGVDEHGGPPRPAELVREVLGRRRPVRPVAGHADAVVHRGAGGVLDQQRPPHVAHRRLPQRRLDLREQAGRVADDDGGDGAQRVEHPLGLGPGDVVILLVVV